MAAYGEHWDRRYQDDESQLSREWHADFDTLSSLLAPYLKFAAACSNLTGQGSEPCSPAAWSSPISQDMPPASAVVVDVGCGSSAMGMQVCTSNWGYGQLVLLDASPTVLHLLQDRYQHARQHRTQLYGVKTVHQPRASRSADMAAMCDGTQQAGTTQAKQLAADSNLPRPDVEESDTEEQQASESQTTPTAESQRTTECPPNLRLSLILGDVRALPLRSGMAAAVIDKGTLDALWSDDDKEAMLRQCARILAPPYGVIASISFATRARLQLLGRLCPQLGLSWRVHVVGSGDPARGHEVRFLTLISRDFGPVPYTPDELSSKLLARLAATGSLIQDPDDTPPAPLFD